jgi:hypothetical protein
MLTSRIVRLFVRLELEFDRVPVVEGKRTSEEARAVVSWHELGYSSCQFFDSFAAMSNEGASYANGRRIAVLWC